METFLTKENGGEKSYVSVLDSDRREEEEEEEESCGDPKSVCAQVSFQASAGKIKIIRRRAELREREREREGRKKLHI